MSRSERYIAPSREEIERLELAREVEIRFDRERTELLQKALGRIERSDLEEIALRIAKEGKVVEWLLESELNIDKPIDLLVYDTEKAIDLATKVDEFRLNYNFQYDSRAYDAAYRGFLQLIQQNRIDEAKTLALVLMEKGSRQMDCSDEGLMQEEIESCLRLVICAVSGTPGAKSWAMDMRLRCRYLCERELTELVATDVDRS